MEQLIGVWVDLKNNIWCFNNGGTGYIKYFREDDKREIKYGMSSSKLVIYDLRDVVSPGSVYRYEILPGGRAMILELNGGSAGYYLIRK